MPLSPATRRAGPLVSRSLPALGLAALVLSAPGCKGSLNLGGGPSADARLTADLYTWECLDQDSDTTYEGVFGFNMTLEYAPDGLQARVLPSPGGCSRDLSMFPIDAGIDGADVPETTSPPLWRTPESSGRFVREAPGFYYDEVFSNTRTCQDATDLLGDGVALEEAASLSGVQTPPAGGVQGVDTLYDDTDGDGLLSFGEEVDVSWDVDDWDQVWIQIRQERDGEAWGSVTCNATGMDSFTVDDAAWALLDETLNVEYINLYVAFQNSEEVTTTSGQVVDTVTRGMHVLVVQEG